MTNEEAMFVIFIVFCLLVAGITFLALKIAEWTVR